MAITELPVLNRASPSFKSDVDLFFASQLPNFVSELNGVLPGGFASAQPLGFRNKIINGNFDVWQRGVYQDTDGYKSADRWHFLNWAGVFSARVGENGSFDSATGRHMYIEGVGSSGQMGHKIERASTLAGKTVTLSYSSELVSGFNGGSAPVLRQNFGVGGSSAVYINSVSDALVGNKRVLVFNIPSVETKTIGENSSFEVIYQFSGTFKCALYGFQLEEGNIATPFEVRPIGLELMLCHRYYYQLPIAADGHVATGQAITTGAAYAAISWPITMRASPTISGSGSLHRLGGEIVSAKGNIKSDPHGASFSVTWSATPFVAGNSVMLLQTSAAPTSSPITADAEL